MKSADYSASNSLEQLMSGTLCKLGFCCQSFEDKIAANDEFTINKGTTVQIFIDENYIKLAVHLALFKTYGKRDRQSIKCYFDVCLFGQWNGGNLFIETSIRLWL